MSFGLICGAVVLLVFASLVTPQYSTRKLLGLLVLVLTGIAFTVVLPTTLDTPKPDPTNYLIATFLSAGIFLTTDFLFLTNITRDLCQVDQKAHLGYGLSEIAYAPFIIRLRWAASLYMSARGVGWNFEPKGGIIQPHPTSSRFRFVSRRLSQGLVGLVIGDLAGALPYPPRDSLFSGPFHVLMFWVSGIGLISAYNLSSAGAVALFISTPEYWPPLFGKWTDAWSLRRFWGRVWHQVLRRRLQSNAIALARALGFEKGTQMSAYTQLYAVFLGSGIIHFLCDYSLFRQWTYIGFGIYFPASQSLIFFAMQAVGITIEDCTLALYRQISKPGDSAAAGGGRGTKWMSLEIAFGYIWVLGFLMLTLPMWQTSMLEAGMNYGHESQVLAVLRELY
ncbi:membrane bound O-acyl transferase family-domain-containing protein [Flagelloscypha sp. PMI_526]|nr:membrane bound O-acyl transferase family-domain-containing protein [Flagelloscypha sp. PMI_526]